MRLIYLALAAFFVCIVSDASCQDSLSVFDHLGMTGGALFTPQTLHHQSGKKDEGIPALAAFLFLTPIDQDEESLAPLLSGTDTELDEGEEHSEPVSIYAIEDRSIHAPHGHLCIGVDAPVPNHSVLLFFELGTTYGHEHHALVLGGFSVPLRSMR